MEVTGFPYEGAPARRGHRKRIPTQGNEYFVDADALQEYISKAGKVEPKVESRLTIVE